MSGRTTTAARSIALTIAALVVIVICARGAAETPLFERLTEGVYSWVHPAAAKVNGLGTDWSHADLHFRVAQLHREAEEWDDAVREYRRGLRLEPEHVGGQIGLGYVYLYQREHVLAEEVLRPVLDLDPAKAYPGYGIIRAHSHRQLGAEADRFLAEYAKRVADRPDTVDKVLRLLADDGLDAEIEGLLERLIDERPQSARYHQRLYGWQFDNDDFESAEVNARRAYEQLVEADRGHAAGVLGVILGRREADAEALGYLEESARLSGDEFAFADYLDYARQRVGERDD